MFEGEAHQSCLALCRELHLERDFEEGDWFWWPGGPSRTRVNAPGQGWDEGVYCLNGTATDEGGIPEADQRDRQDCIWLPLLHQWIALLRVAGVDAVHLVYDPQWGWSAQVTRPIFKPAWAPTPEEAVARLWVRVQRPAETLTS